MEIKIDEKTKTDIPGLHIGMIAYENIVVTPSPQMLKGRLHLFQESLYFDMADEELQTATPIQNWKTKFEKTGENPDQPPLTIEMMLRRIQKRDYLPSVHSAIDLTHFFALKYAAPIGIYDMSTLEGDTVTIRLGEATERFETFDGKPISVDGLPVATDRKGPFGSPFGDSLRISVTTDTTAALQIIYFPSHMDKTEAERMLTSFIDMFTQIHGGEGRFALTGF